MKQPTKPRTIGNRKYNPRGETTSRLIKALEEAYNDIRRRHPDAAPAVFVTYYSETQYGHIWFNAWTITKKGKKIDEIHINSARFSETPECILETLLHEAAHSINRTRGVKDVSRGARYHNKFFKATAIELGLKTEIHPLYGCMTPGLADGTAEAYKETLARLKDATILYQPWQNGSPTTPPTTTSEDDDENTNGGDKDTGKDKDKNRQIKAVCQCGRIIRAARKTLQAAPIICGECESEFTFDV